MLLRNSSLLNHIDVLLSNRLSTRSLTATIGRGLSGEVVLHLSVQLLLCLLGTSAFPGLPLCVLAPTTVTPSARAASLTTSSAIVGTDRTAGAASTRHVSVDILAGSLVRVVSTRGAGAVSCTADGHALGEGSATTDGRVVAVAPAGWEDLEADGLTLGIGSVELADCLLSVPLVLVSNKDRASGTAGAIIANVELQNRSNLGEQALGTVSMQGNTVTKEKTYTQIFLA